MVAEIFRVRSFGLIFFGAILLLGSSGTVTSDLLGFVPSDDSPAAARFVLVATGGVLILGGLTIALREKAVHSALGGWLHLVANALLIGGLAIVFSLQRPVVEAYTPVFQYWGTTYTEFDARLKLGQFDSYADSHNAILVCRVLDPAVSEETDTLISVSAAHPIQPDSEQAIQVPYGDTFRQRLVPLTTIQCHLALLPRRGPGAEAVTSLGQLVHELDGFRPGRSVQSRLPDCTAPPKEPSELPDDADGPAD